MNSSDDANFPLYISCTERIAMKRKNEYSMEFPGPAMDSDCKMRKDQRLDSQKNKKNGAIMINH